MTLLVALSGADGLVVAADSRGTFGDPRGVTAQNDAQKKLYISSKYAAILTAGSGELAASIMTHVMGAVNESDGVTTVTDKMRAVVKQKYAEWFPQFAIQALPNMQAPVRPDVAFLIAGYDLDSVGAPAQQKMFQLLSQMDFAPMLHNYGFALQGIAQYALYLLNRLYRNGSTVEQLKALAAYVITETASQDGKVGGPVQMAGIMPTGNFKELSLTDVDQIVNQNVKRSESLTDLFFK